MIIEPGRISEIDGAGVSSTTAGYVVLVRGGQVSSPLTPWLARSATGVIGALFVLRAIGEFRLVGFFKRVRGTAFARWDTALFSPLSLAIGLAALWLAWF